MNAFDDPRILAVAQAPLPAKSGPAGTEACATPPSTRHLIGRRTGGRKARPSTGCFAGSLA